MYLVGGFVIITECYVTVQEQLKQLVTSRRACLVMFTNCYILVDEQLKQLSIARVVVFAGSTGALYEGAWNM